MFRGTIIRGGKWRDNLYSEDKTYGDFQKLDDAIKWIARESKEFRGGWSVVEIAIKEIVSGANG